MKKKVVSPKKRKAKQQEQPETLESKTAKLGRPTKYTPELVLKLCTLIAAKYDNEEAAEQCGICPATIYVWKLIYPDFLEFYERADAIRTERLADEIPWIAEDSRNDWMERRKAEGESEIVINREHLDRTKIRIDARKWYAERRLAAKYGKTEKHELSGKDGAPIQAVINFGIRPKE